jgi:hypothetical protein
MINKFNHDGDETSNTGNNRGSLKDRFKLLRMREEAGISPLTTEPFGDGPANGGVFAGLVGRSASMGMGVASPVTALSPDEEKNEAQAIASRSGSTAGVSPGTRQASTINLNLAPGTASGIATGPGGDSSAPVDWDLWQAVVYEGPAAVARTSPEELNSAIANGIPQAIRGVVWQVLAKSKNEDLETIYHELVIRGTDKEKLTANGYTSIPTNGSNDKESIASSASSIRSQQSIPVSPQPSSNGDHADDVTKLENGLHAVKGTSSKEEAAKIQKLEKVIKRDLGARTSYSKYVMAAGLQDGLFGVCKAYALYDEAVGYAQGMNFIAMPLLFNVSIQTPRSIIKLLTHSQDARRRSILYARPVNVQLWPPRAIHPRYARSSFTPLSVRTPARGLRTSFVLSFAPSRCQPNSLRYPMVSYAICLPLPVAACPPNLRPHPQRRIGRCYFKIRNCAYATQ